MSALTDLGLLQKVAVYQLLEETTPYLLHPAMWIRNAAAGFIASVAKTLNPVDVMVKLSTLISPYLTHKVVSLQDPVIILNHLEQPVLRPLYEDVIKCADAETFFAILEERQTRRSVSRSNQSVQQYSELSGAMQQMYRRLQADGMSSAVEDKLMLMKDNMIKTARNRMAFSKREPESMGHVDLGIADITVKSEPLGKLTIVLGHQLLVRMVALTFHRIERRLRFEQQRRRPCAPDPRAPGEQRRSRRLGSGRADGGRGRTAAGWCRRICRGQRRVELDVRKPQRAGSGHRGEAAGASRPWRHTSIRVSVAVSLPIFVLVIEAIAEGGRRGHHGLVSVCLRGGGQNP